jgi:hypothetical protein
MNRKVAFVLTFLAGAAVLYVSIGLASGSWNPFKRTAA